MADKKPAQYIKYTPANQSASHAGGATNRVIRMVEAPVDPMEPPKFKHKRVPRGPPSPPVPRQAFLSHSTLLARCSRGSRTQARRPESLPAFAAP